MQRLVDVVTADWTAHRRQPLGWLVQPDVAADVAPDRVDRSTIASALVAVLVADLVARVPSARSALRSRVVAGESVVIDGVAVEFPADAGRRSAGAVLRRVIGACGWTLDRSSVDEREAATHEVWRHVDDPDGIAEWFVTELDDDAHGGPIGEIVADLAASESPIADDASLEGRLAALERDGSLGEGDAAEVLLVAFGLCSRRHRLPTTDEYDALCGASERLARFATEGVAIDHVSIRVDDVVATQDEERISGRPVADGIETRDGRRAVRHRRAVVRRALIDSATGEPIERSFPGSTIEFVAVCDDGEATSTDDGPLVAGGTPPLARPSHTFKVRRRRLSPKRRAEFDEWIARWGVALDGPPLDWDELFDRPSDHERRNGLDIGFGHGESTIVMARAEPDLDVIGVEVHDPGVVTVLDAIEHEPLRNVRVLHGDVIRFLRRAEAETLDVVRIFFPDPWIKARQHHRRLVRADVVGALTDRLRPGGELHLATDIADYAEQMAAVCDAEPRLVGGVVDRPDERPLTRFEQRGLDAGRAPVDLRYHRRTG